MNQAIGQKIKEIFEKVEQHAVPANKSFRVSAYWHIGRLMVGEERKAEIEEAVVHELVEELEGVLVSVSQGKHLKKRLWMMRAFYLAYPEWEKVEVELSWAHYQLLSKIETPEVRSFYTHESALNHWSAKELRRQIKSRYYERQVLPMVGRKPVDTTQATSVGDAILKDNYLLEFTGLKNESAYKERDLETALIDDLQSFLMELGKGFSFVARQKRIRTATGKQFYIDLVFYHFIRKCFVLIDLKVAELSHRDIGQMDMYVRLYEEKWRGEDDHPTIGIILCPEKDKTIIQYSMLKDSKQIFAATYQTDPKDEAALSKQFYLSLFHNQLLQDFPD